MFIDYFKVLRCIEKENSEHKRKIREATDKCADELCSLSDTRTEALKHMVSRWMEEIILKRTEEKVGVEPEEGGSKGKD